jgi:tRNA1(Val) A37 N6-methylase TrmN6
LREYKENQNVKADAPIEEFKSALEGWANSDSKSGLSETSLEQTFNHDIFSQILGYEFPKPDKEFNFFPKSHATAGEGFPDFVIGEFKEEDGAFDKDKRIAVGELKGPEKDLDKVDPSREKSPVEQGFEYSYKNGLDVKWVIVSNMDVIRLYHHRSIEHYQEWEIGEFINDEGNLTEQFWEFYLLLNKDSILTQDGESGLEKYLLERDIEERKELTEEFYKFYKEAVTDIYEEIVTQLPEISETTDGRKKILDSSQKLMHRAILTCYFADHPQGLLPDGILEETIEDGRKYPGVEIYDLIQDLFSYIDEGSPEEYAYDIYAYDGGLFEEDSILTKVDLPDSLFNKEYSLREDKIKGIFGFHIYDFHTDLNEHLLGRIFEESIGDLEKAHENLEDDDEPFSGTEKREDYGLYFTREGLTDFVARNAIDDLLADKRKEVANRMNVSKDSSDREFLEEYLQEIVNLRIADLTCGSGAFLISCYDKIKREAKTVHEKIIQEKEGQIGLESFNQTERNILDKVIHGNDFMSEAIEITKLSIWLKSARKDESLEMLTGNFENEDVFAGEVKFDTEEGSEGFDDFDLIIGNPPWGGEITKEAQEWLEQEAGEFDIDQMDTYELFLLISEKYLASEGRLALVLPHTLMLPEKKEVRTHLLENYEFERYHNLGADWFGPEIRMNTTTLQIKNNPPGENNNFKSMVLPKEDRKKAIKGKLSLAQLENAYASSIPQDRCIESGEIELFRSEEDDELMNQMKSNSIPLGALCESHRGVEMNKAGHIIQCPYCGKWTPPPRKRSDGYASKKCNHCDEEFEFEEKLGEEYIVHEDPQKGDEYYIDGDSFGTRYESMELKSIDLGYDGVSYKDESFYKKDNLFIRQAGVGLTTGLSESKTYCPQSVYIYRVREDMKKVKSWYEQDNEWYNSEKLNSEIIETASHKFLLGLLNSRVFHYFLFKRYGELDSDQAFAKLTQTKIRQLPIPVSKLDEEEGKESIRKIEERVEDLLNGEEDIGSASDFEIDRELLKLYGLDPKKLKEINEEMGFASYDKVMKSLYRSKPNTPSGKETVKLEASNT